MGNSRPWSAAEVEERLPAILERLDDCITDLKGMGERSARAEWAYRKQKAIAYVKTTGRNAEERESRALLTQAQPGVCVADLGLERDLAANAYRDQRSMQSALEHEAEILRTLAVSARNVGGERR